MTDPTQPTEAPAPGQPAPGQQPAAQIPAPPIYTGPPAPRKRSPAILIVSIVVTLVIFVVAFFGVRFVLNAIATPAANSPESIAKTVDQLKTQFDLPQVIDEVTTLDDITAEDKAVHYHYTIAGADTSALTEDALSGIILPGLCADKATRDVLDNDIGMNYSYVISETGEELHLEYTKADC